MTDMGTHAVAGSLSALDARSFAQLLRALRAMPSLPETIATPLARPTSELASGTARDELCRRIADDQTVRSALRADESLPAAIHSAIGSAATGTSTGPTDEQVPAGAASGNGSDRASQRARELRRTLEEERRRREGAEARASAAEARTAAAEAARGETEARVIALEREVSDAADAVRQATERTERRAESRIAGLERDLAAARRAHAALQRDHDRTLAELGAVRSELVDLQGALDRAPAPVADHADGRPLVLPPELEENTTEAASWLTHRARLLLVDGYNVSLALRAGHPLEEQRRWLVERVRPLVVRGGADPIVVFDGDGTASTRRDASGVEVRFTAAGTTADDEIVFAVAATDDPVLVITDDAELSARVRAEGGNVIGTVHLLGAIDG
jgi:predicted RNA-binding protein with PIN domain